MQSGTETERCPGCGGMFDAADGPVHAYMTSSPGCWRMYGEVLAADYSSAERMSFHQLVVDAYAAQHPGEGGPQQIQSVGLHLMTMCLFLEYHMHPSRGPELHRQMVRRPEYRRLTRSGPGHKTVSLVAETRSAGAALEASYEWAREVWDTYETEHETVRRWLRDSGVDVELDQD